MFLGVAVAVHSETLTLTKIGPKAAREGDMVEYSLEIANQGSVNVSGVEVLDTLPSTLEFVQAVSTLNGLYDPATGTWTLPSLGTTTDDNAAQLRLQALVKANLLAGPEDVATATNRALVISPQTAEPIEAEVNTNILCSFCIDWEILSVSLASDTRVDEDHNIIELRFDLHVVVTNNGPVDSQALVSATRFTVTGGTFHPALGLQPTVPVEVALGPGETQTVTFGTNWGDWPGSRYTIAWEFEVADTSLLDPVLPNTVSGSYTGEGYDKDSGGGGCFIATAAYGSYLDPHVRSLRRFRDQTLMRSRVGRAFIAWYYEVSPPVAQYIEQHEALRVLTRLALTPVVLAVEAPYLAVSVLAGLLFLIFRLRSSARCARNH